MVKNGRCPAGQYYCYTNKECKPIPKGFMVDPEGMLRKENGASIDEANKSGDSSLRDWFSKSKSSDGKPGWVQLGGKYAGKPCARQPGQTTKPKCGSSKMKRNLNKKEEDAAFRRKNAKDPNPDRKGKAINVATEEHKKDYEYSMARSELKTVKNAAKRLEKKMGKKGEGELKAWVQSKITKAADYIDTAADYVTNEEFVTLPLQIEIPTEIRDFNLGLMFRESLDTNSGMLFIFDEVAEQSFHMRETKIPLDIAFIREDGIIESIKKLEPFEESPVYSEGEVLCALEVNRGWFAENNVEVGDEIDIEEGKKDACYHKVKSRYSVWPSAYASGALVKCRKVGAANWGNKTKKEEFENWRDSFTPTDYETVDLVKPEPLEATKGLGSDMLDEVTYPSDFKNGVAKKKKGRPNAQGPESGKKEIDEAKKCWKGYKKAGTQKLFGKTYNRCVKAGDEVTHDGEQIDEFKTQYGDKTKLSQSSERKSLGRGSSIKDGSKKSGYESKKEFRDQSMKLRKHRERFGDLAKEENHIDVCTHTDKGMDCPVHGKKTCPDTVKEAVRLPAKTGNLVNVIFRFRSQTIMLKMFFSQVSLPTRSDVQDQINKVYPGAKLLTFNVSEYEPGQPILHAEGAAWTKKAGKNKEGGLNEKGRKSYERENPGSDLKAPSKKVGNPRRASFCARMKGMKKKLTSSKTANDPDSRINKSLRAWNC